ncbi:MAG: PHP domain-containing protein [Clostridia bacterium]|nr:PHP domain-containing protein [Clostridia bacterium]
MFDLHIHSTYSDGSDDVETIIDKIKETNIKYFSITDHDTALSAREILSSSKLQNKIKNYGLTYVTGVEFTCRFRGYKAHILAYDYDPSSMTIQKFEKQIKEILKQKDVLRRAGIEELGYKFSTESTEFLNSRENVRKLDVANCLVNDGYFNDPQDAIKLAIDKVKIKGKFRLDGEEVIRELSKEGVKMVWAHSIHGINEEPLSFEEIENVAGQMKEVGLSGLECFYSLYNKEEISKLVNIANKLGLFITSGSDYHGKNKYVSLAEISCDGTIDTENIVSASKYFKNVIK